VRDTTYHAQVIAAMRAGFRKVQGADGAWHDLEWILANAPDEPVRVPDHLADLRPGRGRCMVLGDRLLVVRRRLKEGN
jgi:hypothetical protein